MIEYVADSLRSFDTTEYQTRQLAKFAQVVEDLQRNDEEGTEEGQEKYVDQFDQVVGVTKILRLKVALGEFHADDGTLLRHERRCNTDEAHRDCNLVIVHRILVLFLKTGCVNHVEHVDVGVEVEELAEA